MMLEQKKQSAFYCQPMEKNSRPVFEKTLAISIYKPGSSVPWHGCDLSMTWQIIGTGNACHHLLSA
jgi:hypothetical protein